MQIKWMLNLAIVTLNFCNSITLILYPTEVNMTALCIIVQCLIRNTTCINIVAQIFYRRCKYLHGNQLFFRILFFFSILGRHNWQFKKPLATACVLARWNTSRAKECLLSTYFDIGAQLNQNNVSLWRFQVIFKMRQIIYSSHGKTTA